MVTVVPLRLPMYTSLGSDDALIVSLNCSKRSNILSSFIEILSVTFLTPAGKVTLYGPES